MDKKKLNQDTALQIITDYGSVLKESNTAINPVSALPHMIDEIKHAIVFTLQMLESHYQRGGCDEEEYRKNVENLVDSYAKLSTFIDDETAERVYEIENVAKKILTDKKARSILSGNIIIQRDLDFAKEVLDGLEKKQTVMKTAIISEAEIIRQGVKNTIQASMN
ncbi:MAG TPA: hypothetical protein VK004_01440 [Ignavibacteria bacterium]|nr:hypothetical protein [Ignavibacteria bacterium]